MKMKIRSPGELARPALIFRLDHNVVPLFLFPAECFGNSGRPSPYSLLTAGTACAKLEAGGTGVANLSWLGHWEQGCVSLSQGRGHLEIWIAPLWVQAFLESLKNSAGMN